MLDHGLLLRRCFGAQFSFQVGNTSIRGADLFLDDTFHNPALITRKRAGFHNLNAIADLATDLIVCLHSLAGVNDLAIEWVAEHACDLDHDRLGHFVAGDDTSNATTIVHASPCASAEAWSCRMVCMRAISRRKMRKRLVSVNWPVTCWKRSFINSSRASDSFVSISPDFRSRSSLVFTDFIPALPHHGEPRSWS